MNDTSGNSNVKDDSDVNTSLCLAACGACTVLSISQGDYVFVTHEDLVFHWFTVFYIVAYAGLFLGTRLAVKMHIVALRDPPFYNLLSGVLQLVATRLYAGAETPYCAPLIFTVATRAWVKSRHDPDVLRCVTLVLDACMLGVMCAFGVGFDQQYLIGLFVAAAAAADVLV
jgi:hypothetical protein